MDDLLLFTPSKGAHMAKLEGLLKALEWIEDPQRSVNYLGQICPIWVMRYSFRTKEFAANLLDTD